MYIGLGRKAFSLLEVVIVVAIIAALAAIAIPRLGMGSSGASDASLEKNLAVLRKAIDHYAVEHNGNYPNAGSIAHQLTRYSNEQGQVRVNRTGHFILGPYIRSIPPLPVGTRQGNTKIAAADANDVGWIYNPSNGHIRANTAVSETTMSGKSYQSF